MLFAGFLLWRLVQRQTNRLRWEDLVATKGVLNAYKLGYWIGVGFSSWVIVQQTYTGKIDAAMLTVYLGFLGGVPTAMSAISSRGSTPPPRSRPIPDDKDLPPVPRPRDMGE